MTWGGVVRGFWGNPPKKREGCGGMVVGVIGWGGYRGVALTRRSQRSPADPGAACVERVNTTYWTQRDLFIELMGRVLKYRVIVFLFRLHPGRRVDGRLGQCRRAQQDGKRLDTPTNPIAKFPTHKENAPPCKKMITTHVVVTQSYTGSCLAVPYGAAKPTAPAYGSHPPIRENWMFARLLSLGDPLNPQKTTTPLETSYDHDISSF